MLHNVAIKERMLSILDILKARQTEKRGAKNWHTYFFQIVATL